MHTVNVTARTTPIKRSSGRSAVAAAAYRAGEKLHDERQDRIANYSNRSGDVWHSEILAPEGAPDWADDRQALWNQAEAAERRKDSRTAREFTLGLPWDMSEYEHEEAVKDFARREFVEKGHVADICFHRYGQKVSDISDEGRSTIRRWAERNVPFLEAGEADGMHEPHVKILRDGEGNLQGYKIFQPHAHVMVTTRALEGDSFAKKTNREFNSAEQTAAWRYGWADTVNERLERGGYEVRVSTTQKAEDKELPLKSEDMPLESYSIEQRGEKSTKRDDVEMNKVHNDATRRAHENERNRREEEEQELAKEQAGEPASNNRFARVQAWWGNVQNRFTDWRDHLRERAGAFLGSKAGETEDESGHQIGGQGEPSSHAPPSSHHEEPDDG